MVSDVDVSAHYGPIVASTHSYVKMVDRYVDLRMCYVTYPKFAGARAEWVYTQKNGYAEWVHTHFKNGRITRICRDSSRMGKLKNGYVKNQNGYKYLVPIKWVCLEG